MNNFLVRVTTLQITMLTTNPTAVADSDLIKGITELCGDASKALITIGAPVCGLAFGAFALGRSLADEQKKIMWGDRMKASLYGLVGVLCASAFTGIISYYFNR